MSRAGHFRKDWLFEVARHCYDAEVSSACKAFVTAPVKSAADDVLRLMDPDPDGGYSKSEKYDGVTSEIWIPCIMNPEHLVELLKYTFKYSALQTRNQLGRTALHEACFANRADSHYQVIRTLVDEHVQNLHAADDHGKNARALAVEPRHRPESPTGHRFREDIIDDKRDDLLDDYTAAVEAIDDARSKAVRKSNYSTIRSTSSNPNGYANKTYPKFELSTRGEQSSKNQPNRLRFDRARDF